MKKKFEIWALVNDGGVPQPMFKEFETDDADKAWSTYKELIESGKPVSIVFTGEDSDTDFRIESNTDSCLIHVGADTDKPWIFESPDGGKTLFKRRAGTDRREQIR